SVENQVHDHLLHLPGVGDNLMEIRAQIRLQRHILSDEEPEHALQVGDDVVQVQRQKLYRVAARESEQLRRQTRAAVGGLPNLVELRTEGVLLSYAIQEDVAVSRNHGEKIREIMRDTAHQPADSLHLLGLLLAPGVGGFLLNQH